jgi:hypothetical protein
MPCPTSAQHADHAMPSRQHKKAAGTGQPAAQPTRHPSHGQPGNRGHQVKDQVSDQVSTGSQSREASHQASALVGFLQSVVITSHLGSPSAIAVRDSAE